MPNPMHMLRLSLDSRKLFAFGNRSSFEKQSPDSGYLVHCAVREAFGDAGLGPFSIERQEGPFLEILIYSALPAERLKSDASGHACGTRGIVDLSRLESKQMPDMFRRGSQYEFKLRACPVLRKARGAGEKDAGAEIDVFLAEAFKTEGKPARDRRDVYMEWLSGMMKNRGASVASLRLSSMKLTRLVRRDKDRKARGMDRPDVIFEGILRVEEPDRFHEALMRGIGRHRSFGFGMLLLKPVG